MEEQLCRDIDAAEVVLAEVTEDATIPSPMMTPEELKACLDKLQLVLEAGRKVHELCMRMDELTRPVRS